MRIEAWPHEVLDDFQGKGFRFEQVKATVSRVMRRRSDNKAFGLKFTEDTNKDGDYTGFTWRFRGPYNEQTNRRDDYNGEIPEEGDVINVTLHVNGDWHDIVGFIPTESDGRYNGPPLGSGEVSEASPANLEPLRPTPTETNIRLGMAFNNLTHALTAGKTSEAYMAVQKAANKWGKNATDVWAEWMVAAAEGQPLPLVIPVAEEAEVPELDEEFKDDVEDPFG